MYTRVYALPLCTPGYTILYICRVYHPGYTTLCTPPVWHMPVHALGARARNPGLRSEINCAQGRLFRSRERKSVSRHRCGEPAFTRVRARERTERLDSRRVTPRADRSETENARKTRILLSHPIEPRVTLTSVALGDGALSFASSEEEAARARLLENYGQFCQELGMIRPPRPGA